MSHTVMKGLPTTSQLHLDTILEAIIHEEKLKNKRQIRRDEINLSKIIYYSMKQRLDDVYMINGFNGDKIKNRQILKFSIPLARALQDQIKKDRKILLIMKNSQYMASLYYAAIFSGVVPLLIDSNSTRYEIQHFMNLVSPYFVFCDHDCFDNFKIATEATPNLDTKVIIANDTQCLELFVERYSDDMDSFQVSEATPDSTALLLPTSGSSGLPKATILNHNGLIAQLPVLWIHHERFPQPTELALLLSSAQWMTHTILMTTCPVYGISLLMTPQKPTAEHILDIVYLYRPTWALLGPTFAQSLVESALTHQLSSLKTVILTGAPLTNKVAKLLKEKLSASCYFGSGVGMTETHGFFTMPGPRTAWDSNDRIINTWIYKLSGEGGKQSETNKKGELLLRSTSCPFIGYYKNSHGTHEVLTSDGWLITGDVFYEDDNNEVHFIERKKFWFKYYNNHISPEELENVINSVDGVKECVVCESEKGPAAGVVLRPGFSIDVRENIHKTINATLSDYKRLRGGIVFVSSLPYTHSGKIKRAESNKLIQNLLNNGELSGH
ncbi:luciferin 4-monooxygenase-like isoform X2 [Ostrinia furnacalis]|uniref:luciferin 4-monooxygenase-like isoform X2 n=1 Tax=Ostrinia furnacalis TaxID=93504 RepID=UPI0010397930|nr:luciferin 4-monooxygenase-like isoform X2 [Ostrinia furnacalis]